jgi:Flp pilus assembly protein TadD
MRRLVGVWYGEAGKVYFRENDPAQAEAHWLRSAAVCPDRMEPLRDLADLYQRQGRVQRAAEVIAQLRNVIARQEK